MMFEEIRVGINSIRSVAERRYPVEKAHSHLEQYRNLSVVKVDVAISVLQLLGLAAHDRFLHRLALPSDTAPTARRACRSSYADTSSQEPNEDPRCDEDENRLEERPLQPLGAALDRDRQSQARSKHHRCRACGGWPM